MTGATTDLTQHVLSLLQEAAQLLEREAPRTDPCLETVLCMVEAAAAAARTVRTIEDSTEQREHLLQDLLATSRAAVTCASFALVEYRGTVAAVLPRAAD
jgi:hypothetical protein